MPVPERLTTPVPVAELPDNGGFRAADTLQLGAAFRSQAVRLQQCNDKLAEIAKLGQDPQ